VHVRYECAVGPGQPVALGVMVRQLVVSEAPRDHPKEHPYSREHPAAAGFASRAVSLPPYTYIHKHNIFPYTYVYQLVVSEVPRDHAKDHSYSREHPAAAGFASRAVSLPRYTYINTHVYTHTHLHI